MTSDARLSHQKQAVIGVIDSDSGERVGKLPGCRSWVLSVDDLINSRRNQLRGVDVLVVGGDHAPMKSVLPQFRSIHPDLPVFALSNKLTSTDKNFYRNHVDGLYHLPCDQQKFLDQLAYSMFVRVSPMQAFLRKVGSIGWTIGNGLLAATVLVGIWWLIVWAFSLPVYLLPSPAEVASAFVFRPDYFLFHMRVTAYEAALGFLIGNSLGIMLAVLLHRFISLRKFTMPVLISFQAIPIVALAPLLVVWFGTGLVSKVAMASIICFFPMVINALQAFSSVDRDYVELFEFYRASFLKKLRMLLMPASFTAIVAAMKISAGLAVVGAIVAELTGADKGLGHVLLNASYRFETPSMFVAMVLSAVLGILFFNMPGLLRYVVPKSWSIGLQ